MKLICKDCPKTFKSQLALKYHVRKHTKPHICFVCKSRFASRDEMQKHNMEHESCNQLEAENFQDLNIVTQRKAGTPKKLDESQDNLIESQNKHNESSKILDESHETLAKNHETNEESQLLDRVEDLFFRTNSSDLQMSNRDTLSDCCTYRRDKILKGKAESKDNVSPYIKTNHGNFNGSGDKFRSRDQNRFKEETKDTDNMLFRSNTMKEKCNQPCKLGNASTKHVCKEEIKNSNDANHFCNTCEKYYKTKSSFSNHSCRPSEVIKKNKTCEICKKTFKTKEHLRQHQRSHSGEKPFLCVSCGKGFTQQGNLIKHMRIHAGTRMFLCEVCSRPFMTKGALTEHSRTHSDEKQYKCEICQKSFRHKHGLDNHRRKRKYPCNVRKYGEKKYPKKKKKGQHADHQSSNERDSEVKRNLDKISVENVARARINQYEGGFSQVNHNLNNISLENVARTNNDEKEVHQLNHNFDNNSVENVARNNQNERGVHQLNHNFDKNLVGHVARNTERGVSLVKQNLDKIPVDRLASNTAEGVNESVTTSTILQPVPTLATAYVNQATVVSDNMSSSGLTFQGNADFRSLLMSNDTHVFGIEPGIQRLQSFTDMLMADVETDDHEKGYEDLRTAREENQDNMYKTAENYTRINPMVDKETHYSVPNNSNMIAENFQSTDFDIPRSGDKMIKYNQEVYNSQVCKNFQGFQSKATEISHFYPPSSTAYCQLQVNPVTHSKAKIGNNFGLSECNRISPHSALSEHRTPAINVGQNEYDTPKTTAYCELQVSPQAAVIEHRTPDMNVGQNEYDSLKTTAYYEHQVSAKAAGIEHRAPDMNVRQNEYEYLERSNGLPNSYMNNSCDTFDAKGALESDQPVDNRMVLTFPDKNNSVEHQDKQPELMEQTSGLQPLGFNEIFDRSSNPPQRIEVEMTIEVITEDMNAIQESEKNIEHNAKHKEDFGSNIAPVCSTAFEIPRNISKETDTMSSLVSHKMSNKNVETKTRSKAVAQTTKAMSEEEILKIIEKAESKNFKCDECNRNFANEYCRSVHVCKKQKESDRRVAVERVNCYTCGRNYSNKYLLKRHSCRPLKQSKMQKILKANMFKFKKKNDAVVESENSESDFESTFKSMQEFLKRSRSALPKSNAKRKSRKSIAKKDTQTIGCENGKCVVESPKKDTVAFVENSSHIKTRRNKCRTMANNINATDTNSAVVGKNKTAKRLGRSKCNNKFHNESKSNVQNLRIDSIGDKQRSNGHSECNNARSESVKHQSPEFPSDARNDSDKDIRNDSINKDNTNDRNKNTRNDGHKGTRNDGDKDTRNDGDNNTRNDVDKSTRNDGDKDTRKDGYKDTRNDGDKDTRNDGYKDTRNDGDKDTRNDCDKDTRNDINKYTRNYCIKDTRNDSIDDTRRDINKGTRNDNSKAARNESSNEAVRFDCKVCRKSYKNKVNLKKHSCKPTAEETRICKECGKSFNQRNHLLEHMRIHSGEKPYLCKTCGKLFNQESNLMKHMRIHNPQKLFKCEICDREFTQKGALTEHRKVHLSAKPFVCLKCNKGFRHKHGLQHHMNKKFPCDVQSKSKTKVVVDKKRKNKVKGDNANTESSVDKITEQNGEINIPIMPIIEVENLPVAAIAVVSEELDNLDEVERYNIWATRVNTVKSV